MSFCMTSADFERGDNCSSTTPAGSLSKNLRLLPEDVVKWSASRKVRNVIDTHTHLDFPQYDNDRERVIEHAFSSGIEAMINIGIDLDSSKRSITLAERYESIYAAVAFHPHNASQVNKESLRELEKLASHPKVVAIGEIGLDYFRNLSPAEAQIKAFREQLELAERLDLPVVIHIRNAHKEAFEILTDFMNKDRSRQPSDQQKEKVPGFNGVLHCFSGDERDALQSLKLGFYLAFNGTLTYKNSRAVQVMKHLPLDAILIETDCPYLTPEPLRGKRNEPRLVRRVLEKMTELFPEHSLEKLDTVTTGNAKSLFALP